MVVPAIEVVITNVGNQTIEDQSTQVGKDWLEAFRSGAEIVPGIISASWSVSHKDPSTVMHFIGKNARCETQVSCYLPSYTGLMCWTDLPQIMRLDANMTCTKS